MKKICSIIIALCFVLFSFSACAARNENTDIEKRESTLTFLYDSAYRGTDQSAVNAYEAICKGVIEGSAEVRMNTGLLDSALQLFYTSFPLSVLVENININADGSGVVLRYKNEAEEHKKLVSAFEEKVNEIKEKCSEGTTNKTLYAIRLYNYISSTIKISTDAAVNCYDTIMKSEGTSFSYSNMFEYLLRQADIPSAHIIASDKAGTSFGLSSAELNGELYYFDVMSEYEANEGKQLIFFGMTYDDVKEEGLSNLIYSDKNMAEDASDLRFEICRRCASWTVEGASLLVTTNADDVVEIAL